MLVRADSEGGVATSLGVPCGRAARDGTGALVAGVVPGGWLILVRSGSAAEVVRRVEAELVGDRLVSVVDVTHGHAMLRLAGPGSVAVLEKLCMVDLAEAVTPDGAVFRSLLAGLTATVIRDDEPGRRSYLLLCDRSYGQYLVDVLVDAGAVLG